MRIRITKLNLSIPGARYGEQFPGYLRKYTAFDKLGRWGPVLNKLMIMEFLDIY